MFSEESSCAHTVKYRNTTVRNSEYKLLTDKHIIHTSQDNLQVSDRNLEPGFCARSMWYHNNQISVKEQPGRNIQEEGSKNLD